jgi:hypothetical protein
MLIINEIIYENDPYNCSKITRALSDELYGMEGESLEEVFDEIVITEEFVRKCLRAADNLVLENWTNDQLETEVHLLNLAGNLGEAERLARLLSSR